MSAPTAPMTAPPPTRALLIVLAVHVAVLALLWVIADVLGAVLELTGRVDSLLAIGHAVLVVLGLILNFGLVVALVVLSILVIVRARGRLRAVGIAVLVLSLLPAASGSVASGDFSELGALVGQSAATIWAVVIVYDLVVLLAVTAGWALLWRVSRHRGQVPLPA